MSIPGIAGALGGFVDNAGYITVDMSEIDDLVRLLAVAAEQAPINADHALDIVVPEVWREAHANAKAFHKRSTGELAGSLDHDTSGQVRRVFAPVKQAALLEYGTPNTGAPIPWLTGPGERGSKRLLEMMAEAGDIW